MLSLETAKKLKDARLQYRWTLGDMADIPLSVLLSEIEKRGFEWALICVQKGQYQIKLYQREGLWAVYTVSNPEEAVAQALIWILEQEKER